MKILCRNEVRSDYFTFYSISNKAYLKVKKHILWKFKTNLAIKRLKSCLKDWFCFFGQSPILNMCLICYFASWVFDSR